MSVTRPGPVSQGNDVEPNDESEISNVPIIKLASKTTLIVVLIGLLLICFTMLISKSREVKVLLNRPEILNSIETTNNIWEGELMVTYYTLHPSECGKDKTHRFYGYTKSGRKVKKGITVAVDPKVIPLGSVLIDDTGHIYIAEDTGNMVKGYMVDIFYGEGTPGNVKKANDMSGQKKWFRVIEQVSK